MRLASKPTCHEIFSQKLSKILEKLQYFPHFSSVGLNGQAAVSASLVANASC